MPPNFICMTLIRQKGKNRRSTLLLFRMAVTLHPVFGFEFEQGLTLSSDKTDGNFLVPKIAILLAAYNGMQWIEAQLNSILEQKNVGVKIFISVDLSTDGTLAWCQAMALRYACVEVLPAGERFGGAAPNFFRMIRDDFC